MRVYIPVTGLYTCPDLVVVCGEPQLLDDTRDALLNPNLVVEVLPPSTEAYDRGRGREFGHYRSVCLRSGSCTSARHTAKSAVGDLSRRPI